MVAVCRRAKDGVRVRCRREARKSATRQGQNCQPTAAAGGGRDALPRLPRRAVPVTSSARTASRLHLPLSSVDVGSRIALWSSRVGVLSLLLETWDWSPIIFVIAG